MTDGRVKAVFSAGQIYQPELRLFRRYAAVFVPDGNDHWEDEFLTMVSDPDRALIVPNFIIEGRVPAGSKSAMKIKGAHM